MCAWGSGGPCGWGRHVCYLWGCGLIVSRTPGAAVGGGPARHAPAPAPIAGADGHPLHLQEPPLASVVRHRGRAATLGAARRAGRWPAPCPACPAPLASAMPLCQGALRRQWTLRAGGGGRGGGGGWGLGPRWLACAGGKEGKGALLLAGAVLGVRPTPLAVALASPVH